MNCPSVGDIIRAFSGMAVNEEDSIGSAHGRTLTGVESVGVSTADRILFIIGNFLKRPFEMVSE
jgi:hypothetical protein